MRLFGCLTKLKLKKGPGKRHGSLFELKGDILPFFVREGYGVIEEVKRRKKGKINDFGENFFIR